ICDAASRMNASRARMRTKPSASVKGSRNAATIGGSSALSVAIRAAATRAWRKSPTLTPGTTQAAKSRATVATNQDVKTWTTLNLGVCGCQAGAWSYACSPASEVRPASSGTCSGIWRRPTRSPVPASAASPRSDDEARAMSRSYGSVAHHAPPRPPPRVPSRTGELVWLGHASVLVELDGVRLVTDPVLRPRIGPLVRISAPAGPRDVGVVDGVLLSHLHADHADLRSLRALRRSGPIIAPRSARHWLMGRGLGQVTEAAIGVEVTVGVVTVTAVPAV